MHKASDGKFLLDAALSDLDGTLFETERLLYLSWVELVRRAGADFSTFDYAKIIGRPDLECCRIVSDHFALGRVAEDWHAEYKKIFFDLMDRDLEMRPGAYDLIVKLEKMGVPLALVTSANLDHAEKALGRFSLRRYFRTLVTADTPGLASRKPHPAPYLLAAALLGVRPDRCIAFEDSPAGVRSARAAGCYVVAVPHEHSPAENLGDAHLILPSLAHFDPERLMLP